MVSYLSSLGASSNVLLAHTFLCLSCTIHFAAIQVRSAQSLTLLSEALKLSLLLSKTPDPSLNDEAIELIKSTEAEKLRCAVLLAEILQLDAGKAEQLVKDLDRAFVDRQVAPAQETATSTKQEPDGSAAQAQSEEQGPEEEIEDDDMEDVSAG